MSIAIPTSEYRPHAAPPGRDHTGHHEAMPDRQQAPRQTSWPARIVRIKDRIGNRIRALARSSWTKFTTGVVLLASGMEEAIETFSADLSAFDLGTHHGLVMLGFVNILAALPDMLDGLFGTFLVEGPGTDDGVASTHEVP